MARCQARLKPIDAFAYPYLHPDRWYDVMPLFPGVTQRMLNFNGDRITRLETADGYVTVKASHLEFRYNLEEEPAGK
ncbi:MAG: hypothetical protein AB7Q69_06780 [Gemmatimonadales bacterium]